MISNISQKFHFPRIDKVFTIFNSPIWAFFISLGIYILLGCIHGNILEPSDHPYFNYLADAFLHHHLYLGVNLDKTIDLISFHGKWYMYWPPFPAFIFMPFVKLFGINISDILITIIIGALNVFLLVKLLHYCRKTNLLQLTDMQTGLLALFFAFGTANLCIIPFGSVWFTSQAVAIGLMIGAYIACITLEDGLAFFITGLLVAAAMLTRMHLFAIGIFPAWILFTRFWNKGKKKFFLWSLTALLPFVLALIFYGAYNWFRFGNIFDIGYAHHDMSTLFISNFAKYGAFNFAYLPTNFYYQYIFYPFPLTQETLMGGSLFLLSPLFFAIIPAIWHHRHQSNTWFLLLTIAIVNIPILLLMGTGWKQFGPRYTLDFIVPMILLTGMGMKRWPTYINIILISISIVQYVIGFVFLSGLI